MYLPSGAELIIKRLSDTGFEAFAVGGFVRDAILGLTPGDCDITTSALPEDVLDVFSDMHVIKTGLKHGTVTVMADGEGFEVTTYRVDSDYSDHRHPDSVTFTRSLTEDLARRDFTMNALAYSHRTGIVDPFGGVADINLKTIRAVGDAGRRFTEDALRIMRALRFSAVLGFDIEEGTKSALLSKRELLKNVSAERLYTEIKKLLCGKNAGDVIVRYSDVISVFIPELLPMKGFDQKNAHHCFDVLTHTAKAVDAIAPDTTLRLAALLHDVGKPETFSVDENGVGHFYAHASVGAAMADRILRRLKADNASRERITALIKAHGDPISPDVRSVTRALNKFGEDAFFELVALMKADISAQAPEYSGRLETCDELTAIARDIIAQKSCFSMKDLAVNGSDILAVGVPRGKKVGETLEALLSLVLDGKIENDKSALLAKARELI